VYYFAGREGVVEGGEIDRPFWLGFTVHYLNSIVAWLHLTLAPHSFSASAERMSIAFAVAYLALIIVCSRVNGQFPYPFLNKLPFPSGFMAVAAASIAIFVALFRMGRFVKLIICRPGGPKHD
jgi:hypothetical protein